MKYVIAGPCAIESVDSFVQFADTLVRLFEQFPQFRLVYKGSFDKANRTLQGSPRGVGLVEAELAWRKIRENHPSLMLTTDVHETWQCRPAAAYVDVLQIPAMLGRQTDLLNAAAATGAIVNVKKPIWETWRFYLTAQGKLEKASDVWFTYRGSGTPDKLYMDVDDMWRLPEDRGFVDITHTNEGSPMRSHFLAEMVRRMDLQVFAEVHPDPNNAISDARHQLSPAQFEPILHEFSQCPPRTN